MRPRTRPAMPRGVRPPRPLVRLVEPPAARDCFVRESAPALLRPSAPGPAPPAGRRTRGPAARHLHGSRAHEPDSRLARSRSSSANADLAVLKARTCAPRILPALSKQEVPLQSDVVPRELRSELRNLFVRSSARSGRKGRMHQRSPPATQALPLRAAFAAANARETRDVERRQARRVPMSDRLAEATDVMSGAPHQLVSEAPMHIESLLLRNLSGRRDSDQIVRGAGPFRRNRRRRRGRRAHAPPARPARRPSRCGSAALPKASGRPALPSSASTPPASPLAPRSRAVTSRPASTSAPAVWTSASSRNGEPPDRTTSSRAAPWKGPAPASRQARAPRRSPTAQAPDAGGALANSCTSGSAAKPRPATAARLQSARAALRGHGLPEPGSGKAQARDRRSTARRQRVQAPDRPSGAHDARTRRHATAGATPLPPIAGKEERLQPAPFRRFGGECQQEIGGRCKRHVAFGS